MTILLIYDQPPPFKLRDFSRPLAPLEVQHEPEEADLLLETMARASNFAMEPVHPHAFIQRTPDDLKLDGEIHRQTERRTLQEFTDNPSPARTGTFRVIVVEDVADRGRDVAGSRSCRLADRANVADSARVAIPVDSDIGRTLATLNWRGTETPADPSPR